MIAQLEEEEKSMVEGLDFQSLDTMESKTDLWLQKRMGRFTASEFHRLMGYEDKPELPKGGQTYATEVAVETLLTGPEPGYSNDTMDRGNDIEPEAMEKFMEATGLKVEKYGDDQEFVELGKNIGATPDGRILPDGGVEGKAPNAKTHFFYLTNLKDANDLKKHCSNYYWQIQGSMFVTGATYWYFFSYDPRYANPEHRMHILKIERNDVDIEKLKRRIQLAVAFRNQELRKLNG